MVVIELNTTDWIFSITCDDEVIESYATIKGVSDDFSTICNGIQQFTALTTDLQETDLDDDEEAEWFENEWDWSKYTDIQQCWLFTDDACELLNYHWCLGGSDCQCDSETCEYILTIL